MRNVTVRNTFWTKASQLSLRPIKHCGKVLIALIACAALSSAQAADIAQSFTIHQELPNLVHVDLGGEGSSHGDMLAFDAVVKTDKGVKGKLSGFVFTVDIPEQDHEVFQDRIVQMVFDIAKGKGERTNDRLKAFEIVNKMLGLNDTEKHEVLQTIAPQINIINPNEEK